LIRRPFDLPDPIFAVAGTFLVGALYFGTAAVIELTGIGPRLPFAGSPPVGLTTFSVQTLLAIALLRAARWARPVVVMFPWAIYLLEWGLSKPALVSAQAAELLITVLIFPGYLLYCLYFARGGRQWFAKNKNHD